MKNPKVRLVLSLLAMFLLGGISGAGLTFFCHPFLGPPPKPEKTQQHLLNFLTERLNLTAEQQEKIKPITFDFATEADKLHQSSVEQFQQLANATDDRISVFLTPGQKAELDKLRQERNDDLQGHAGGPGGPEGPGGPGGPGEPPPQPPPGPPPGSPGS